ncbi:unnamed protein product [Spirodela intermedia]|uniref:HSF-type DNA-binding domain-containing protein n=1 Tax=Spirodela intermedia TaxID=51605 RepID=A0A7I8KUV6_SPIIN|nr:unnamed protein product [Spirodela intermedia]
MQALAKNGGGPAPFLVKTHQMVEDAGTDEVISWNEEGNGFVVWKMAEFSRDLLPVFFKHSNFSSFVRQLNTYGFRKVVPDRWEFANDNFRRGEQGLLSEIRRRKPPHSQHHHGGSGAGAGGGGGGAPNSSREEDQSSASTSSPPPHRLHRLSELSDENEKLRRDNETLSSELAQARGHCADLLRFLSKYVDPAELAMAGGDSETPEDEEDGSSLRLFGVCLTKRRRCDGGSGGGGSGGGSSVLKKMMSFESPWVEPLSSSLVKGAGRT